MPVSNSTRLKKVQAAAKALRKKHPKLTHIEALKKAWASTKKSKTASTTKKKPTERTILSKIKKVKKSVNDLNKSQKSHMIGKIGESLQKRYVIKYKDPIKGPQIHTIKAYSLVNAKAIANHWLKYNGLKTRASVKSI
jgi:hypothetical protein